MKKILSALIALSFSIKGLSQKEIKVEDAKNNVGDTVKICTKIFDVIYEESTKGSPTCLYTAADNANAPLTFIIWGEKRKYFDYKPEKDLREREVCITGKIVIVKDKAVMIVGKQSQIDIK